MVLDHVSMPPPVSGRSHGAKRSADRGAGVKRSADGHAHVSGKEDDWGSSTSSSAAPGVHKRFGSKAQRSEESHADVGGHEQTFQFEALGLDAQVRNLRFSL